MHEGGVCCGGGSTIGVMGRIGAVERRRPSVRLRLGKNEHTQISRKLKVRTSSSLLARLLAFFFTRIVELSCRCTCVGIRLEDASISSSCVWSKRPFDFGFEPSLLALCIRECLVSSSERENRFSHPGKEQRKGFSPVCVRIWRV